jgi:hypothetical protein
LFTDYFADGVAEFSVKGIDTGEMLDPLDPFAFETELTFYTPLSTGPFDNPYSPFELIMTPIVEFVGGNPSTVDIDIKPGSDSNCLNSDGHGVIPVAILGSDRVDIEQIDPASLLFAGLSVRVKGNSRPQCGVEDLDLDGDWDLVCQFIDSPDDWAPGDAEATLTGNFLDGTAFVGSDSICVVPN